MRRPLSDGPELLSLAWKSGHWAVGTDNVQEQCPHFLPVASSTSSTMIRPLLIACRHETVH